MSMHPKAVTLMLAGCVPLRHINQTVSRLGFRVGSGFTVGARMLYLRNGGVSDIGLPGDASSYKTVEWDDIPSDLWDGVPDKLIEDLLGEMT